MRCPLLRRWLRRAGSVRFVGLVALLTVVAAVPPVASAEPAPTLVKGGLGPAAAGGPPCTPAASVGSTLYMVCDDGEHGRELWRSDGTPAGTRLVADIYPGAVGSAPDGFVVKDNTLYFFATSPGYGRELWRSDGSSAGTTLVKDINPGTADSFPQDSRPQMTRQGSLLLFAADDGSHGLELWRSDGTSEGTALVADINPSPGGGSSPRSFVSFDSATYFVAYTPDDKDEIWRTDGTAEGTTRFTQFPDPALSGEVRPGFSPVTVLELERVGDDLVYLVDLGHKSPFSPDFTGVFYVFARYDGRAGGDVSERPSVYSRFGPLSPIDAAPLVEITDFGGDVVAFRNRRDVYEARGVRLVRLPAGGSAFEDLSEDLSGPENTLGPAGLTPLGSDRLLFIAEAGGNGREPWVSSGTPGATGLLADIRSGAEGSNPTVLGAAGGVGYFSADDGVHGRELWATDGTPANTRLVADLEPGASGSSPAWVRAAGTTVYFLARTSADGWALYRLGPPADSGSGTQPPPAPQPGPPSGDNGSQPAPGPQPRPGCDRRRAKLRVTIVRRGNRSYKVRLRLVGRGCKPRRYECRVARAANDKTRPRWRRCKSGHVVALRRTGRYVLQVRAVGSSGTAIASAKKVLIAPGAR